MTVLDEPIEFERLGQLIEVETAIYRLEKLAGDRLSCHSSRGVYRLKCGMLHPSWQCGIGVVTSQNRQWASTELIG